MKKILLAGIVILFAVLFVTCDGLFPEEETNVEYTDVEYSPDGSRVTVYLDGVGVPKTAAQRAMTTDLARIAYDYLEVIFLSGGKIARNSWELGQSAAIGGVVKGADYLYGTSKIDNVALMFVGRKDSKLLLGIGRLAEVDHSASSTTAPAAYIASNGYTGPWATGNNATTNMPNSPFAYISSGSKSVTFYIESVKTGLFVSGETPVSGAPDSFQFMTGGTTGSWSNRTDHSQKLSLGNSPAVEYPLYALPQMKDIAEANRPSSGGVLQWATYTFYGAVSTFATQIRVVKAGEDAVKIERRLPRYMDGGMYYAPRSSNFDIKSQVRVRTPYAATAKGSIINPIPLIFEVLGNGLFSFYLEIPVFMITDDDATNSGPAAEIWKIRTGFGSELYSLDDGVDGAGGCVLMGVGNTGADLIDIEWDWLK